MFGQFIADRLANAQEIISLQPSQCLRLRFNKSRCGICRRICPHDAITLKDGICINRDKCSQCMLCVSSCPSSVFNIRYEDISYVLAVLRKLDNPVLSCNRKEGLEANEKTFCLGALSEEILAAIAGLFPEVLTLNVSMCEGCENSAVIGHLEKRIQNAESKISFNLSEKIRLINNRAFLNYQDVVCDRREFFREVKKKTAKATADIMEIFKAPGQPLIPSQKCLPYKRELLNKSLPYFDANFRKNVLNSYCFSMSVDAGCDLCSGCVGLCPTGALKAEEDKNTSLHFNASLCTGCRLCEQFCPNTAISVNCGVNDENIFSFICLRALLPKAF